MKEKKGVPSQVFVKDFTLVFSTLLLFFQILRTSIFNNVSQWLVPQQRVVKENFRWVIWKFRQRHSHRRRYSNINVVFYTIQIVFVVKSYFHKFLSNTSFSVKSLPVDCRLAIFSEKELQRYFAKVFQKFWRELSCRNHTGKLCGEVSFKQICREKLYLDLQLYWKEATTEDVFR